MMNQNQPMTRKEAWARELEVPPESTVSFESQAGPLETEGPMFFIVQDLKKQAWVFCNQQGIQYDTLEWGAIDKRPKDEKKPKGPWKFFIRAETPTPRTLGQTAFTVAVEYQFITLVYRGVLEGDEEDKAVVKAMKDAEAQREKERLELLDKAATQGVATQPLNQDDTTALIEQMAKDRGVTTAEFLAGIQSKLAKEALGTDMNDPQRMQSKINTKHESQEDKDAVDEK
jgi:hypothetical protein